MPTGIEIKNTDTAITDVMIRNSMSLLRDYLPCECRLDLTRNVVKQFFDKFMLIFVTTLSKMCTHC